VCKYKEEMSKGFQHETAEEEINAEVSEFFFFLELSF
jgi:hypothetical protein